MQVLIDAREKLDISWGNNDREKDANETKLMECNTIDADKFVQYAATIRRLWQDRGIRRAYERRKEFQMVFIIPNSWLVVWWLQFPNEKKIIEIPCNFRAIPWITFWMN